MLSDTAHFLHAKFGKKRSSSFFTINKSSAKNNEKKSKKLLKDELFENYKS